MSASSVAFPANLAKGLAPIFIACCMLLSGCVNHTQDNPTGPTPVADSPELEPLKTNIGSIIDFNGHTSDFDVTQDAVFQLLVAEFAGQRGRLEMAVTQYLAAAKSLQSEEVAERAARIAVFARRYDAAIEAAKIWAALTPDAFEARQILAAMYIRTGDAAAAQAELESILNAPNGERDSRLRMIVNLLGREQDKQTALSVMEKLLETRTGHVEANVAHALLAIRAEQADTAKVALQRVAELDALDTNLAVAYISLLQKQNRTPEALTWLRDHVSQTRDSGMRMVYARLLADAGKYDPAREEFLLLAKEMPSNSDVIYALGLLNLQAERITDAELNFKKLVRLDVRKDDAKFYIGQIQESRGEFANAIKSYRDVSEGQNYFMAQVRVALLLANQKDIAAARAQLQAIRPANVEQEKQLLNTEAEILAQNGQYAEAMSIYDSALEDGYDMELLYTRAMLAEQMGRLDVLERDLRRIIEREPDNSQALNALGYTLADRTTRFEEALSLIERALVISPNDFYILDSMGWVMYRLGRFDESIKYLNMAREIRDDPEVAAHLGEVLWVMGNKDEARQLLQNAIRDTPNDERLLEVIKKIQPES
ncbi:MAG: tetratricopeptide repeat protein [Gammaproteobacteria bacterium]